MLEPETVAALFGLVVGALVAGVFGCWWFR